MAKEFLCIDEKIASWIAEQSMFFVATAPLDAQGHVNCSPKGLDTLRILGPNELAYLDFPGSGVETISHVKENSRITIMMCAFRGPPKIYRFHGLGHVYEPGDPVFEDLRDQFPTQPVCRAIIKVSLSRISDSCGFGVPLLGFEGQRDAMKTFLTNAPKEKLEEYMAKNNRVSIDGLPGLNTEDSHE